MGQRRVENNNNLSALISTISEIKCGFGPGQRHISQYVPIVDGLRTVVW